MSAAYELVCKELKRAPKRWCVTGVAGFIGSHLLQTLLDLDQDVTGIDSFVTGKRENLKDVERIVGAQRWKRFTFIEGDICDHSSCVGALRGCEVALHQAALGSVPRSMQDPVSTTQANVEGFVNVISVAREVGVKRFVYASSSSVYGDEPSLPKIESRVGKALSPYAVSKRANELYADLFSRTYGYAGVGLRYFNIFGPRQDPQGPYAAVIPRWIGSLLKGKQCSIYGDGETSRDFCYVANAIQANILAACVEPGSLSQSVFNVAVGTRTSLNELYQLISQKIAARSAVKLTAAAYEPFREGDVRHSLAEIYALRNILGYEPTHSVGRGIGETVDWFTV